MAGNTWGESWGIAGAFAWGDSWGFEGFVAPAASTIPPGGASYLAWWEREWARLRDERKARRKAKRVPKRKRELLEELDDIILELRSKVRDDEAPKAVVAEVRAINHFADLAIANAEITAAQVRLQIKMAEAIIREIDDEEILILALH